VVTSAVSFQELKDNLSDNRKKGDNEKKKEIIMATTYT